MVFKECYTHKIESDSRHIGCPIGEYVTDLSNDCVDPPCPYSATCCKKVLGFTHPVELSNKYNCAVEF